MIAGVLHFVALLNDRMACLANAIDVLFECHARDGPHIDRGAAANMP